MVQVVVPLKRNVTSYLLVVEVTVVINHRSRVEVSKHCEFCANSGIKEKKVNQHRLLK